MKIELVPIDSVFEDPANARVHSEKQINELVKSLERFGQQYPLVVTEDKIIRKGNGTHRAAKQRGQKDIYVVWCPLADYEAKAYSIADNKLGMNSEWDIDLLATNVKDLADWNPSQDWSSIGFDKEEITPLLGEGWEEGNALTDFIDNKDEEKEKTPMGKPIKLTPEQRETIDLGISLIRLKESDPAMPEGRAIELMVAEFLSGDLQNSVYVDIEERKNAKEVEASN